MPERRDPASARDQAAGLRRLFPLRAKGPGLVPLVAPEDGGEQAALAIDVAAALARQGRRVLLLDGEAGRLAPMLGLKARYDLRHVLSGERPVDAVALPADDGLRVMPAARALRSAARGQWPGPDLPRWLAGLAAVCDVVVACTTVDTVSPLMSEASAEVVLASGVDAWQVARAYARIKLLHERHPDRCFRIAWFPAGSVQHALAAQARLERTTQLHLGIEVGFAGAVVAEAALRRARDLERSLFEIDPDCDAARAIEDIAVRAASPRLPLRPLPAAGRSGGDVSLRIPDHVHRPRHA